MAKGNMTIRMEPELKAQAAALFKTLGMDLSTATGIFYRDAALAEGSISYFGYGSSIHPQTSSRQLPLLCRAPSALPKTPYQKMLQNRYVCTGKNIAQSQKLQIFPVKSAFYLAVLTCVWYYT